MLYVIKYKPKEASYVGLLDEKNKFLLEKFNWYYRCGYAGRCRNKKDPQTGGEWIHLHREVLKNEGIDIPVGMVVDHINRDRLDNRLCNLRVITHGENGLNKSEETKKKMRTLALNASKVSALIPRSEKQKAHNRIKMKNIIQSKKHIHKGLENYASKKIINTKSGVIYSCIREASEKEAIVYSTLRAMLNGQYKNKTSLKYFKE